MVKRILRWLRRRAQERRMYAELRRLDERMLRDIGLTRQQLY